MIKTKIKTIHSLSRKEKKANKRLYNKQVRNQNKVETAGTLLL